MNYDYSKNSMAVVASDGAGNGAVLWYVGGHLSNEIEEAGLHHLGDLGLDGADCGIWVWEGKYLWSPGGYEYPEDGDMDCVGDFRPPTQEEWVFIMKGESPWNDDDWLLTEESKEPEHGNYGTFLKLKKFQE